MTSTALVGPLPQVSYQDGTREVYTPPVNTLDPRYEACTEHRTACDCREAVHAEDRQELAASMAESRRYEQWAKAVAQLHQRVPNQYIGDHCGECSKAWPCPTWRLTADVDWLTSMVGAHYDGRFVE